MSTVVVRKILASPARLSSAVWQEIITLITKGESASAAEFNNIKGIGSCLINDESLADHPLVVKNKGPRLRVYCLYGEDAISGEDKNEDTLSWSPTSDSWHAFLPCIPDEVEQMTQMLKGKSNKFSIYDIEKGIPDDEESDDKEPEHAKTTVNWSTFEKL